MNYAILDIEATGLLEEHRGMQVADRIHCMSVHQVVDGEVFDFTLVTYDEMREFFLKNPDLTLIGHEIIRYDIPMLEKFLGIKIASRKIDTLALSWYLYPNRNSHGLGQWGEDLGIAKPVVDDWETLSLEVYIRRCEEDVKINTALFMLLLTYLKELYSNDSAQIDRIMNYLAFKMDCAREQREVKWKLDIDKCKTNLEILQKEEEDRIVALTEAMPEVTIYKKADRPKVMFKKDGSLSAHGQKWMDILKENNLPDYHVGTVKIPIDKKKGNPGSHQQLKEWLFSLGWKPDHIKIVVDKQTRESRKIPQISNQEGTDVSDSVKDLYEVVPELKSLEGLFVVRHRKGILQGFLDNVNSEGYVIAEIQGLTNTLRFQHTVIVNLPQIPKLYWEEVRSCLIAEEGELLCGADMSSLEDNTKQHYMMFFDPEYVKQMRTPGFDPHIDISARARAMSYDEGEFYKWYDKKKDGKVYEYTPTTEFKPTENSILEGENHKLSFEQLTSLPEDTQAKIIKILKPIRLKMKKGNFASVYGAGIPKLAITLGVETNDSRKFHTAYWIRNKAVKQVADACIVKVVRGQMWLFNPVSRFWYSLRAEKDKFSTLNQSTGCYCFDTWLKYVRGFYIKICGQFHDEKVSKLKPEEKEDRRQKLLKAIELTNQELKLNVPLGISIAFGKSYSDIH